MQTFGRLRLDVENCVRELVDFGVARMNATTPPQYAAERPGNDALIDQLDTFLERRATVSTEDQSPSVQRFREMIGRDEKMLIVFEWIRTAAKSETCRSSLRRSCCACSKSGGSSGSAATSRSRSISG